MLSLAQHLLSELKWFCAALCATRAGTRPTSTAGQCLTTGGLSYDIQKEPLMVQTKQHIVSAVQSKPEELIAFGVRRFGIFGSFLRGQQQPESDVDVLVEFEPQHKTFDNFMGLIFSGRAFWA